jgi:hypothetical protein
MLLPSSCPEPYPAPSSTSATPPPTTIYAHGYMAQHARIRPVVPSAVSVFRRNGPRTFKTFPPGVPLLYRPVSVPDRVDAVQPSVRCSFPSGDDGGGNVGISRSPAILPSRGKPCCGFHGGAISTAAHRAAVVSVGLSRQVRAGAIGSANSPGDLPADLWQPQRDNCSDVGDLRRCGRVSKQTQSWSSRPGTSSVSHRGLESGEWPALSSAAS